MQLSKIKAGVKLGIYDDISIDDYHNGPGLSNTGISLILQSPAKYQYEYLSGNEKESKKTPALILGSALHTYVLEPALFNKKYFLIPEMDRRTKAGKELYEGCLALAGGRELIKESDFDIINAMANSIQNNIVFQKIRNRGIGKIEHSAYWEHGGTLIKTRPDWFNDDFIVDLKSTDDASLEGFTHSIRKNGYHRQAAMQIDGLALASGHKKKNHVFLVVEKKPPYLNAVYALDHESIAKGREEYYRAIEIYDQCVAKNEWPGYSEKIETISLPSWYMNNY